MLLLELARWAYSSVLFDKKLYFSSGYKVNSPYREITNEFIYLDVSKPFSITDNVSIPWFDLTYTGGPQKIESTACIGGQNNDFIFVFGGSPSGQSFINVNQFDTSKNQWSNITFTGSAPTDRYSISCAKLNNGLIAIFSGDNDVLTIKNELWIFNTLILTWSIGNATNAPPTRRDYCAITLPNENILYIGGFSPDNSSFVFMPMNRLSLYNTKSDTWTNMSISDPTPSARSSFSAVLTPNGRIIIFGGSDGTTVFGDLWILDTSVYQWSKGNILNPIAGLTLDNHVATLVDDYMFIAFGRYAVNNYSSKIYMLNVSQKDSYSWVTEFIPTTTVPNNTTTTIPSNTATTVSSNKKIGEIVGGVF
ncbi:4857_t:CDS:2, partial [Gigaspora margarita]